MAIVGALSLWLVAPAALAQEDQVVARVNGVEITEREVTAAMRDLRPSLQNVPAAQHRDYVVRYLTDLHLVAQAAEAAGLADEPEFAERMEYLANRTLMEVLLDRTGQDAVDETAARELYEQVIGQVDTEAEVHAKHILVETEEEASELHDRLAAGGDFAALAEEHSIDPGSAPQGGDLGYIQRQGVVPEFGEAAFALEPGETSQPVESQFGWHIIRIEDRRQSEPPAYDEVEDELMNLLARQAQQELVLELRQAADIEIGGEEIEDEADLIDPEIAPAPAE